MAGGKFSNDKRNDFVVSSFRLFLDFSTQIPRPCGEDKLERPQCDWWWLWCDLPRGGQTRQAAPDKCLNNARNKFAIHDSFLVSVVVIKSSASHRVGRNGLEDDNGRRKRPESFHPFSISTALSRLEGWWWWNGEPLSCRRKLRPRQWWGTRTYCATEWECSR